MTESSFDPRKWYVAGVYVTAPLDDDRGGSEPLFSCDSVLNAENIARDHNALLDERARVFKLYLDASAPERLVRAANEIAMSAPNLNPKTAMELLKDAIKSFEERYAEESWEWGWPTEEVGWLPEPRGEYYAPSYRRRVLRFPPQEVTRDEHGTVIDDTHEG